MRILQLCKKFPYPLNDGESIAVTFLAKALKDLGHEVTLLSMNTKKHFFDLKQLPDDFDQYEKIATTYLDNSVNALNVIANYFTKKSFHISRFVNEDFREKLIQILKEGNYDVVLLETVILAPYIPEIRKYSKALVSMRAHNVEHEIWAHIASNTNFYPKKIVLNTASERLKKHELGAMNEVDLFVAISKSDLKKFKRFGLRKHSIVIPIGLDETIYQSDHASFNHPISLSFIGSLDWMPNIEGLNWFLDNAWPMIQKTFPKLKLEVAGKKTPQSFMELKIQNIRFLGEIPDAPSFINKHSIMIVPLLSGSGIRAKIIEGMMLGKVIISTTLGLEGIPATHKENVFIADTPIAFLDALKYCEKNKNRLIEIGQNAREFALDHFSNLSIAQDYIYGVKQILGEPAKQEPLSK